MVKNVRPGNSEQFHIHSICGKQNTRRERKDTKEQSVKVCLFKAALKQVLNFKYILKTLIKICLSVFLS